MKKLNVELLRYKIKKYAIKGTCKKTCGGFQPRHLPFFLQSSFGQKLQINDSAYFEKRGVNVMVFSSEYNGMFFDEKTSGY